MIFTDNPFDGLERAVAALALDEVLALPVPHGLPPHQRAALLDHAAAAVRELTAAGRPVALSRHGRPDGEFLALARIA